MKTFLAFDTETNGLPLFKEPSEDPRQPHIVQLGAVLVDLDTRKEIASLDVIVKPEGWAIPDDVAAIHGITTEHAQAVGIPESLAVEMLLELHRQADFLLAHNASFDQRIVRIACKRFFDDVTVEEWKAARAECTQLMSTPILKLPPTAKMRAAGRFHHKSANLGEAYEFFTGKPLENAHSAIADVRGCIEVYFGAQEHRQPVAA
ncbi:3'-5' exonuclease [Variovorax ureilyticus]|uniref:3'-5' exonuclease n=1 Tax=Variovorax ureilyticus TaxID=1836198 RepID=UPI003D6781ED